MPTRALITTRLVSLNRARRGAYSDIDSVNISGGLVVVWWWFGGVAVESEIEKPWLAGMSVSTTAYVCAIAKLQ